ncbi:MAG TPA: hypothetical protein VK426_06145, partial [Methanobacterium sp.]|nr:hypothetical protein [Methanobacterium sp.]
MKDDALKKEHQIKTDLDIGNNKGQINNANDSSYINAVHNNIIIDSKQTQNNLVDFSIKVNLLEFDELLILIDRLESINKNVYFEVKEIKKNCYILTYRTTAENYEEIYELFKSGKLSNILETEIDDLYKIDFNKCKKFDISSDIVTDNFINEKMSLLIHLNKHEELKNYLETISSIHLINYYKKNKKNKFADLFIDEIISVLLENHVEI